VRPRQKFPYTEWEDYQAGLFGLTWGGSVHDAVSVLACGRTLYRAMSQAVNEWPKAAAHHLTDDGENQRAWLGWAACGITHSVPAHLTRAAWWQLTESQRAKANDVADQVIAEYHRAETLPF
jgi:hypothetical protein